jgi:hypothetical protein
MDTIPEALVDGFLDLYVDEGWSGTGDWAKFRLVPADSTLPTTRAAREAARRLGITVHVDVVPETYNAPVKPRRDQAVIRVSDTPAPWAVR